MQFDKMNRREFITLFGGATAWPLVAHAQQRSRRRRIGVLMNLTAGDPEAQTRIAGFMQGLQELGWAVGRNVRVDYRWGGDADRYHRGAEELVALAPDLILASTNPAMAAAQLVTRTVPIVFAGVGDPVAGGYVDSLARPGGNATGFTVYEYSIGGKWLELLKEVAPHVTRAVILRDPALGLGTGQLAAIQAVAPPLGVELTPIGVRDAAEIERAVTAFARGPNDGLIVVANPSATLHRELIVALANVAVVVKSTLEAVTADAGPA